LEQRVPGAFELALAAQVLARSGSYDAIIALGCIIRGGTPHFEYVSQAATYGLQRVALDTGVPVAFGVLTTEDFAQAEARAGGEHGNKGFDAAQSAIEMALLLRDL
jgi:6,7-dimethyl-8-ribityllumazine synthase